MPKTALKHFKEDISRARSIFDHAKTIRVHNKSTVILRDDLYRAAWMMAVGAMDAYFSDAYSHCVACTLRAKQLQVRPVIKLPNRIEDLKIPVSHILKKYDKRQNWAWRMAARQLMERESVLDLEEVKRRFNAFSEGDRRFMADGTVDAWVQLGSAKSRLFGKNFLTYLTLPTGTTSELNAQKQARGLVKRHFESRFHEIIQRRHDCIHNCDRPKTSPQSIRPVHVKHAMEDIEFLVTNFDTWVDREYIDCLTRLGSTATTIAHVQY